MGSAAKSAVPAIIKHLESDGDDQTRKYRAIIALGEIGATAASRTVPVLIQELNSENSNIVRAAVSALGRIGPAALSSVPMIKKVVGDWKNRRPKGVSVNIDTVTKALKNIQAGPR